MSTKCSVWLGDLVHVWRDAIGGDSAGLVLDVAFQNASGSTPALEVNGARIPLKACVAIAEWVQSQGYLDPNSFRSIQARKSGDL